MKVAYKSGDMAKFGRYEISLGVGSENCPAGAVEKAVATFKQLADTFPVAPETVEMKKRLQAFLAQRRAAEEDEKRVAALGFKGLPIVTNFAHEDIVLTLGSLAVNKRWTFDSWGDGWRFQDAEKDRKAKYEAYLNRYF